MGGASALSSCLCGPFKRGPPEHLGRGASHNTRGYPIMRSGEAGVFMCPIQLVIGTRCSWGSGEWTAKLALETKEKFRWKCRCPSVGRNRGYAQGASASLRKSEFTFVLPGASSTLVRT